MWQAPHSFFHAACPPSGGAIGAAPRLDSGISIPAATRQRTARRAVLLQVIVVKSPLHGHRLQQLVMKEERFSAGGSHPHPADGVMAAVRQSGPTAVTTPGRIRDRAP